MTERQQAKLATLGVGVQARRINSCCAIVLHLWEDLVVLTRAFPNLTLAA
jgi:hypothetical protein